MCIIVLVKADCARIAVIGQSFVYATVTTRPSQVFLPSRR